ncbi:hypothetical protein XANCAGTX0491_008814 [Xanthoria calcicola]
MGDMQAQELAIMDKQAGRLVQPIYQIKLCGSLQQRRFRRKRDILRIAMKPFKRPASEWSGFNSRVFIEMVVQIPIGDTRHQVAGDTHIRTYTAAKLIIEHQSGNDWWIADNVLSQRFRQSPPRPININCVAIFVRGGTPVAS